MGAHESGPEKEGGKEQEVKKTTSSGSFETLKQHANIDSVLDYAKTHTKDTIAYLLVLIGILLSAAEGFYGDLLIGLVAGFYFSREIIYYIKNYKTFVEQNGIPRSLILAGTIFALFLSSPGIFLGAIVMAFLSQVLRSEKS